MNIVRVWEGWGGGAGTNILDPGQLALPVMHHGIIRAPILKQQQHNPIQKPPQREIWLSNQLYPTRYMSELKWALLGRLQRGPHSVQTEATSLLLLDYLVVIRPLNRTRTLIFLPTITAFMLSRNFHLQREKHFCFGGKYLIPTEPIKN